MSSSLEEKFIVKATDTDFNNRIKVSSLFNYMQDIASVHAAKLNLGYKELLKFNLFWVLSFVKIEIESYPAFNEVLKVKTWPKTRHKFYSLRDFYLYRKEAEIFCRATTGWILLKSDSKRPADITNLPFEIPFQPEEKAVDVLPEKLKIPEYIPDSVKKFRRKISYSDIDINKHVNNSRYIEFIFDCFDKDHLEKKLKSLTINFLYESKFNDELEIFLIPDGHNNFLEVINVKNNVKVLLAFMEWQ